MFPEKFLLPLTSSLSMTSDPNSKTPFTFPEFDDLPATTITTMVYPNFTINGKRLYKQLNLSEYADHTVLLHTKQERKAYCEDLPVGKIISIQTGTKIKGCIIRKLKKQWCQVCQLWETIPGDCPGDDPRMVKVLTVSERYVYHPETEETEVLCYCSECKTVYTPAELKILSYFRNQVMVYMTTERNLVNLMIFPSSKSVSTIKMAGCSSLKESRQIIANFWRKDIYPSGAWSYFVPRSERDDNCIRFVFEECMINLNFDFAGSIDPEKFLEVWKKIEGSNGVKRVTPGKQSQRSIKITFDKLNDIGINVLRFLNPQAKTGKMIVEPEWPSDVIRSGKKKPQKSTLSIVVFMTSSTLVTGKNYKALKHYYEYFKDVVCKNESKVREKILDLDLDALTKIIKRKIV